MGERFGSYEILRKLAAGGMAEVFLAKQTSLGGFERLVCIKRILPHLTEQEDFITMFQDEARIAANLIHPNIAQIYDIGEVDGAYYIAMEYVRGEDLRRIYNAEVARGRAMPLEPAAQITLYAAAGLDFAHRQTTIDGRPLGIVHRDISPQNILVTYDGHVKIVDFGVAKAANKVTETRSGVLKGKYSYMSPEQASGDPIDARTDIFALGITLYEVTTGTRLFKRDNELETLHAVIECEVTPPSKVIPDFDPDLETIVMRALAYDPDDRYPNAGDVERDLERFLINRKHPTGPSSLGAYMQDLFAEKLADELLFGGQGWEEGNTPSVGVHGTKRLPTDSQKGEGEPSLDSTQRSDPVGPDEATVVDQDHAVLGSEAKGVEPDLWGESSAGGEATWGMASNSASLSGGATAAGESPAASKSDITAPRPRGARSGASAPSAPAGSGGTAKRKARRQKPPRWFASVAIGALLMGVGAGLTLIFTGDRSPDHGPSSGPMAIDSEPRGARVEFLGLGAADINEAYSGHRTPFTVTEGFRVDVPLRARFLKDGYDVLETDMPKFEVGVVPKTLFVELVPVAKGSEAGVLMLLSTPQGAEVSVDGLKQDGLTPLTEVRVAGGQLHKVEFNKPGYKTRWETRYVEPGSRIFIDVNLHPEDGTVTAGLATPESGAPVSPDPQEPAAEAIPGAVAAAGAEGGDKAQDKGRDKDKDDDEDDDDDEHGDHHKGKKAAAGGAKGVLNINAPMKLKVSLGSRVLGETPMKNIVLEPGTHKLRAESQKEGFTFIQKVHVAAGRNEDIELRPRKGNLAVNATPWAFVRIGKEAPAETPLRLELYEGEYQVVFECPDGKRKKRGAKVAPGQTATVTINCRE